MLTSVQHPINRCIQSFNQLQVPEIGQLSKSLRFHYKSEVGIENLGLSTLYQ